MPEENETLKEAIEVTEKAVDVISDLLKSPPSPNSALQKAVQDYKQKVKQEQQ